MIDDKQIKSHEGNLKKLLVIVFLICVFLLSLIKIEDTDTWTHLSLGKLVFNLKALPEKEPFNFPGLDRPFHDPEWFFDVVFYIAYMFFNLYGVILLKATIITTAFYVLLKDSLIPHKNYISSIIVLILILFMVRHRFVERPDIVLMLFLSFTIFSLNAFIYENKKYIYLLPLIQILWANMHPSIVVMPIPFIAVLSGGILQGLIRKRYGQFFPDTPSNGQLKTIAVILLISVITSLLNPYFTYQFVFPFKLANVDWWRDEIMELQSPTWKNFKSPYLLTAALIISFLINIRNFSIIRLFLVAPFVYLSFSAIRFIFLLGLVGGPLIVKNIGSLTLQGKTKKLTEFFLIFLVILLTTLTLLDFEPFYLPDKIFGFGINYDFSPEGALQYLDKKNITGRIFNTFEWGGYITWRDFPRRSAYVDGRGNLSYNLLNKLDLARARADVLDELHKKYSFEVAILNYPKTQDFFSTVAAANVDAALSSRDWALVYWDDLSLVYLKRGGKFKGVIEQDEYRYVKPANGPYAIRVHDKEYLSGLISDLNRNIKETGSSTGYAFLGFLYNERGLYNEAVELFSRVKDSPHGGNLFNAYQGLAFAYGKLGDYDKAVKYYKKALKINEEAPALYNIGIIYLQMGDEKKGAEYFERALELNKNLLSIYPKLISIYQKINEQDKLEKITKMYEAAKIQNAGVEHFQKGLKAWLEQKYEIAIEEYKKSIEENPSNPAPYSNLGFIYFDIGFADKAYGYQKKALDIDPGFANAHYGLALVYTKWRDREGAKKHWEEYLRIEPKGYYSRKAKEELDKL